MAKNGKIERDQRVPILLSKDEKAALEAHANRIGLSVNALVRLLLADKIEGFAGKTKSAEKRR